MTVLRDHHGDWTATPTGWGYLLKDPEGNLLGLYPDLEAAKEKAMAVSEYYDEVTRKAMESLLPLSLEEEREREELEEDYPDVVLSKEEFEELLRLVLERRRRS